MLLYLNVLLTQVPHVAEVQKRKPFVHRGGKSATHHEEVLSLELNPICCVLLSTESWSFQECHQPTEEFVPSRDLASII